MNKKEESRLEYSSRINRVMDYIDHNLDQPLDLNIMAEVANFSPYHFHRIFTFMIGETPNNFLVRVRVEKAAVLLYNPRESISEIAYRCGFSNVSTFSRTFRKYFGITAQEFRRTEKPVYVRNDIRYSKNGKTLRKNGQHHVGEESHLCSVELKDIIIMDTKIEVKKMPEMRVIYCRHMGAFNEIYKAYDKLCRWAAPRGLMSSPNMHSLTVYHDDPSVTSIDKVRQDACITVDEDVKVEGEIGKMIVPGGNYAVGHFEIDMFGFEKAWNTMCNWFTESGYQAGEGVHYELYYNDHREHPEHKFILDICIPVKPL